jgi:hypothetical protein
LFWIFIVFATVALPAPAAAPPKGEKYALLVGVRDYDRAELTSLRYPESDITKFSELLQAQGFKRVALMTQSEGAKRDRFTPTAGHILQELGGILADRDPADTVLVALAGHGVQFKGDPESYFCPSDTRLGDKTTLIPLSKLYDELGKCKAGFKLLLVDACRNDPQSALARGTGVALESVTRPQELSRPGGVAALFSCSAGEQAFEDEKLGHGVFFHFVIEGWAGKAVLAGEQEVSLDGLAAYLKRNVSDYVKGEISARKRQMPQALLDKTQGVIVLSFRGEAPQPNPDKTLVTTWRGTASQSGRIFPQELTLRITGNQVAGSVIVKSHVGDIPLEIKGSMDGLLFAAKTYRGNKLWSEWEGTLDPVKGTFSGKFTPRTGPPQADPAPGTFNFTRK